MFPHHQETIRRVTAKLQDDPQVQAVLLAGSIAHGFETEQSDVDILILVDQAHQNELIRTNRNHYYDPQSATYPGGYVDGKYITREFLHLVRDRGNEPTRFAFQGASVLFSREPRLGDTLADLVRYPREKKADHIRRFYAQLETWKWYSDEAQRHKNTYLLNLSVQNLILFGGRMVLAWNEQLFPYHKWFLRVLGGVREKPANLLALVDQLCRHPETQTIDRFYQTVKDFQDWDVEGVNWPASFAQDVELRWMTGEPTIGDL